MVGVDFLRATAILLVLLYHLSVPGFGYAYLGVDLFFLISGFLMARLYGDLPVGAIGFYRKRARRILPAYFTVLIATLAITLATALPHEAADSLRYGAWSAALMPNIGFWTDASYFDREYFRPFLHLWSLGVEVQLYLAFPLIVALYRRSRLAVALLTVASFLLWLWLSTLSPKAAFFMAPTRLWEFMAGFYLAKVGWEFSWLRPDPVMRTVARYSYSIYLVHFPVIALLAYQPFGGTQLQLGWGGIVSALGLTAALSFLLHHCVERTRNWRPAAIGMLALTSSASPNLSAAQLKASAAWFDRDGYRCPRLERIMDPTSESCWIAGAGELRFILVGDSHADALKRTLGEEIAAAGDTLRLMRQNFALGAGYSVEDVLRERPSTVIVHSTSEHMDLTAVEALARRVPVILIMPQPQPGFNVPQRLYEGGTASVTDADYLRANAALIARAEHLQNVRLIWPDRLLCRPICAIATSDGRPLYYDSGHMTLTGAETLRPIFRTALR